MDTTTLLFILTILLILVPRHTVFNFGEIKNYYSENKDKELSKGASPKRLSARN
jgi:hypothetical protein